MIYLGPGSIRRGLRFGMVFKGGISESMRRFAGECPEVLSLIVPVEKTNEVRSRCRRPGTKEAAAWTAVEKALKSTGEEVRK